MIMHNYLTKGSCIFNTNLHTYILYVYPYRHKTNCFSVCWHLIYKRDKFHVFNNLLLVCSDGYWRNSQNADKMYKRCVIVQGKWTQSITKTTCKL